jgi:hypothetical protein
MHHPVRHRVPDTANCGVPSSMLAKVTTVS